MDAIFKRIHQVGIVPVIKITNPETAVPLAKALARGGIPVAEITFRTEHAAEAIKRITSEMPDMLTGAGTVTTLEQVDLAQKAGAQFVVTPGFNPAVVDHCIKQGMPVIPGTPSTSDIERALERGLKVVKFFPAEAMGGLPLIKAVAAPYTGISFMPTGGINPENLAQYLAYDRVLACGGSWMVDQRLINVAEYEQITHLCRSAINLVLGFQLHRFCINALNPEDSSKIANAFSSLLGLPAVETARSHLVEERLEILKDSGIGQHGEFIIACNNLERAVFQLAQRGFEFTCSQQAAHTTGKRSRWLKDSIAGFAIELIER
jgi:2-dehydro-3-deoxyphosphogluconate aldolase/(4S)-4-hydroxy-2-oxoglutarate aldolase